MQDSITQASPQVRWVEVDANADGQRLDNFLLGQLKGVPKSLVYRVVRKGEVRINKKRAQPDTRIHIGDQIRIPPIRVQQQGEVQPVSASLRQLLGEQAILYESRQVLVLNKPAGLAVHGGSGVRIGLIEALRQVRPELDYLELLHRLDKDTSGCLLLAKSRSALLYLQQQLYAKTLGKYYFAWVVGHWPDSLQQVDAPIDRLSVATAERLMHVVASGQGKPAQTRFRVLQRSDELTLVEAEPVTGRTHQIRVHARYAGYPLLGDPKYGDAAVNQRFRQAGAGRLYLHAQRLRFSEPDAQQTVEVTAPLDDRWLHLHRNLSVTF